MCTLSLSSGRDPSETNIHLYTSREKRPQSFGFSHIIHTICKLYSSIVEKQIYAHTRECFCRQIIQLLLWQHFLRAHYSHTNTGDTLSYWLQAKDTDLFAKLSMQMKRAQLFYLMESVRVCVCVVQSDVHILQTRMCRRTPVAYKHPTC